MSPAANVTHAYEMRLIYMLHVGHDSFIRDMWDVTRSYGTWLMYMTCRRVAHEQCDSCIWDMTHSDVTHGT